MTTPKTARQMRRYLWMVLALTAMPAWAADRVTMLDAQEHSGKVLSITDDEVVLEEAPAASGPASQSAPKRLSRKEVAAITLAAAPDLMTQRGAEVIVTGDGGRLAAGKISLAASKLSFDSAMLGHCELPLESAKAIYWPGPELTPADVVARCRDLKAGGGREDVLVAVPKPDDWQLAEGVLKGVDASNITFNWQDADRTIARPTVRAVLLAGQSESAKASIGTAVGTDGSIVPLTSVAMSGDQITLESPSLGKRPLSRSGVSAIRLASERVISLCDIKPTQVKQYGYMDTVWPFQLNKAVSGKPIRLDGLEYADGLGLHSFCELTYDLSGQYRLLVARVGIDDAVRPGGASTLTVSGDGKELSRLQLTGRDPSSLLRVDVTGIKQLMLRVDFGLDQLDVSDHVDLAGARLIKP